MKAFLEGFEKKANLATKSMGILGKGSNPLKSFNPGIKVKQPQVPKPDQAIRGVSSMKI